MSEDNRNIENFFQKHLQATQEVPFDESHWEQLSDHMDAAGMVRVMATPWWQWPLVILTMLLLLIGAFIGGWVLRDRKMDNDTVTEEKNAVFNYELSINQEYGMNPKDLSDEECEEMLINDSKVLPAANEIPNNRFAQNPTNFPDKAAYEAIIQELLEKYLDAIEKSRDENEPNLASGSSPVWQIEDLSLIDSIDSEGVIDSTFLLSDLVIEEVTVKEMDVILEEDKIDRLAIGVSITPDFNSAGFGNKMSASIRPGLVVFYKILPKISMSVGAHFDQKRYTSTGEEYNPPTGFWGSQTNGVLPSIVDGSCRVIDFPVNLHIQLSDGPRLGLGGSVGISSYILLDEAYDFEFDQENPGAATSWESNENSQVWAGLINASIYMTVPVTQNTELIIEPYYKSPIKDIGWARVELYGTGVQFTIKYNFVRKPK